MILICEKCHTRYLLPSHSLAPDGRLVRCSNCGHEWYQEYEEDEFVEDSEGDEGIEPIPESVKPIPEGSELPSVAVRDEEKPFPAGSILASVGVFAVLFAGLVAMKTPITNAWPQSGAFYQMIGMEPALPGAGLIFDGLNATSDNTETGGLAINLKGNIVNLSDVVVEVPVVRFTLNDAAGEAADRWYLTPEQGSVEPHGEMEFLTIHETEAVDTQGIMVGFTLTDAADETVRVEPDEGDADVDADPGTVEDTVPQEEPAHDTGGHH